MITIRKGTSTRTVTPGAYENYYKHLGYEPVGVAQTAEFSGEDSTHPVSDSQHLGDPTQLRSDEDIPEGEEEPADLEEVTEDEVDLSEIPLSEMTSEQLCEYADQLGLDRSGVRTKKELRTLIRTHLT